MEHRRPLQSDVLSYIKGLENVHCVLRDPGKAREFYTDLFGMPSHTDGAWSEFKISGFDFAVTSGDKPKFIITFKVERLDQLRELLEQKLSIALSLEHGDYGDYVEVCPGEGFCVHFFQSKNMA